MEVRDKPVSTVSVVMQSIEDIKHTLKPTMQLAFFTMFLPKFVSEIYFGAASKMTAGGIIASFMSMRPGSSFEELIKGSPAYLANYLIVYIILATFAMSGYLAQVRIAFEWRKHHSQVPAKDAFKEGLSYIFPKGLIFFLFIGALLLIGQSVMPPLIFVTVMAFMSPVLIVVEKLKFFESFKYSIFLRYARHREKSNLFTTFFTLSGVGAVVYFGLLILNYLFDGIMGLKLLIPSFSTLWTESLLGLAFSPMYFVAQLVFILGVSLLVSCVPTMTVNLYFMVRQRIIQRV